MLAGGRDHQHGQARPRLLRIERTQHRQRIGDLGAAPAGAGLGDLEITARRRAPALHLDAGVGNIEQLAGLMLAEHAGDVVVDHHDLIDLALPLLGEHADGGRAAADPHPLFRHAVDDRRIAGLHHHGGAAIDGQFHRLAIGEIHQRVAGDAAFLLGAAGQMMHAAERQHLRAVFAGRDMADRLALRAHGRGLRAEIAVGVDLHLDAAIAENAFGHDRDHVDAVDLGGDDEGRRLVIGIGRSGADRGHEHAGFVHQLAVPVAAGLERHQPSAMRHRPLQHDMRIDAHQFAVVIGIAIARARRARLDVAHHRTGIAADLVADGGGRNVGHEQACGSEGLIAARGPRSIVRIRTMLRVDRNPVKRQQKRKCRIAA